MGQLVLVTGATRGIGRAISEKFLAHGFDVIGMARSQATVTWPVLKCDLEDVASIEETFCSLVKEYGVPRVLVNNAGTYFGASSLEETISQFEVTMNVNVRSVFRLTQLFSQKLRDERLTGSIVNISSVSGRIGSIDPAYAASKGAIDALTKSFARGLSGFGIRVNAIAPGPINTDLADRIPEERKQQYMNSILLKRFGEPEEIANLALFLASDAASLITGEIVYATGGML